MANETPSEPHVARLRRIKQASAKAVRFSEMDVFHKTHKPPRILMIGERFLEMAMLLNPADCRNFKFSCKPSDLTFINIEPDFVVEDSVVKQALEKAVAEKKPYDLVMISSECDWKNVKQLVADTTAKPATLLFYKGTDKKAFKALCAQTDGLAFHTGYFAAKSTELSTPYDALIEEALGSDGIERLKRTPKEMLELEKAATGRGKGGRRH